MKMNCVIAILIVYVLTIGAIVYGISQTADAGTTSRLNGAALHEQYCSKCHPAYPAWVWPQEFFDVKWKYMLLYIKAYGATPSEVAAIKEYVEDKRQ